MTKSQVTFLLFVFLMAGILVGSVVDTVIDIKTTREKTEVQF